MNSEPALILGAVQAALVLVVSFGLPLSNEQMGAILALTAALLAIVTRAFVTPSKRLEAKTEGPK